MRLKSVRVLSQVRRDGESCTVVVGQLEQGSPFADSSQHRTERLRFHLPFQPKGVGSAFPAAAVA
jgi:hypothetical protein